MKNEDGAQDGPRSALEKAATEQSTKATTMASQVPKTVVTVLDEEDNITHYRMSRNTKLEQVS